ncbi:hypothetical protein G9C85_01975 [Halorubellus sp. JP-L1]|uniref:hypothetical protein n=1 Tax=Halorubellus sp. JP-L1 TaxID=2715753 RepID=UPI0014080A73|nr:hypothetical protein [Halorubellus sp. JP-L1]NHN40405.1 hypothetical protein [Halorubellus sp. JP-L1]
MSESELSGFFDRSSSLFTILGVFGAISVYFTQLDVNSQWRRLGIVSSLIIFVLTSIAVQRSIPPESSHRQPFDYLINSQHKRSSLIVFYVAFWGLVVSICAIVVAYSDTLIFLLQFVFTILGVGIGRVWSTRKFPDRTVQITDDPDFVYVAADIIAGGLQAIAIGGGSLLLAWELGLIPFEQLVNFRIESMWLAAFIGLMSGIMVAGGAYIFNFSMLVGFRFLYRGFPEEISENLPRFTIHNDIRKTDKKEMENSSKATERDFPSDPMEDSY